MSTRLLLCFACLTCAVPATAQFGTPFPRSRSPYPSQQPQGTTRRTQKKTVDDSDESRKVSADGVINEIKDGSWTVQADDTRYLTLKITASTQFRRDAETISRDSLNVGDRVHVESTPDSEQNLTATLISLLKPPPKPEEPIESMEITPRKSAERTVQSSSTEGGGEPNDPDRPRLTRGMPKQKPHSEPVETEAVQTASVRPRETAPAENSSAVREIPAFSNAPAEGPIDPILQRARAVALAFTSTLPNFEVQQITTRYQSTESGRNWTAQDTVSADVTYRSGKEEYKNIRINNKLTNKDMMDIPGARSTGEFGTTLVSLFAPASRTEFKKLRESTIQNRTAIAYSYVVQRPNSDYRIFWGSQWIVPGYSGRVWIDKETSRALRIEIQADAIPADFPLDKVEAAIDYGPERLGSESYILPIAGENLSCLRGTRLCGRNALSFRNYRLYKSDAVITFDAK